MSFGPSPALSQKSHIADMLPLPRLEDEPKSGAVFVYLFAFATLNGEDFLSMELQTKGGKR